jgi:hypothetical protein
MATAEYRINGSEEGAGASTNHCFASHEVKEKIGKYGTSFWEGASVGTINPPLFLPPSIPKPLFLLSFSTVVPFRITRVLQTEIRVSYHLIGSLLY